MKVILLRDVAKIGKRYEIVDVPDGYALNKLIPRRDADPATPVNVKRVTNMRQKNHDNKEGFLMALKQIAADLNESPISVAMQANEQGHLFQAVHANDIISAAKIGGVVLEESYVSFDAPIKSTGEHNINLKNHGESFIITINVVAK
jgi:large subunit ribosomal protein L9